MYTIQVMFMSGPDDGRIVWLKDHQQMGYAITDGWQFTIGRHDSCDLQIPYDTQVSREHAFLKIIHDDLWLQDNESRNGTYLDDKRLTETVQIDIGQLFRVGYTWLRVQEVTI